MYKDMRPDSYIKIKKELVLLRKINPLYHDFSCKFETLYRFQNGSVLPDGSNCTTNKDTLLQYELGNENVGIALPFDDKRETPFTEPDCYFAGIQHPKLTKSQNTQIAEKKTLLRSTSRGKFIPIWNWKFGATQSTFTIGFRQIEAA